MMVKGKGSLIYAESGVIFSDFIESNRGLFAQGKRSIIRTIYPETRFIPFKRYVRAGRFLAIRIDSVPVLKQQIG